MEENAEKTICTEMDINVEKDMKDQEDKGTSKIDVQAVSDCLSSHKPLPVITSVIDTKNKEIKEAPEKTSIQIDNQFENVIESASSGSGDFLKPFTGDQEVHTDSFDIQKVASTALGTDSEAINYGIVDKEGEESQSPVKDVNNLPESRCEVESESTANVFDETTGCAIKVSDTEIDSKTEEQLLSENSTLISQETIEHLTNKLCTDMNEAIDDNSSRETHIVGVESEIKSTVEEKENSLNVEIMKDSENPQISVIDNTLVDKVLAPEPCSDSKITAENIVFDTVNLKTRDEMDVDKSNASIDFTNDNTELENALLDSVTHIPKDFHTEADTNLNIKANDTPMDVIITYSPESLKELNEDLDKPTELDSKNAEKLLQENLKTEQENVSDVDMSQDGSIDFGSKEHGLKHPNMMIEIPTQELIDIGDSLMDNTSDVSANSEDKNGEHISSSVDEFPSRNKENDEVTKKLAESIPQENSTEIESEDLTEKDASKGTITFEAFEVKESKCLNNKNDSEVLIEVSTEIDTTPPEESLPKDVESSPSETNNGQQISIQDNSIVPQEKQEPLEVEHCCSIATLEHSLSGRHPASDMESPQASTSSLPSTSQESFLASETSVADEPSVPYESSTSNQAHMSMAPDTSDEVPEVSDSLGLLAESSRVMEDDEEQETSEHDDVDDDDEFDPDDGKFCLIV